MLLTHELDPKQTPAEVCLHSKIMTTSRSYKQSVTFDRSLLWCLDRSQETKRRLKEYLSLDAIMQINVTTRPCERLEVLAHLTLHLQEVGLK